MRTRVAVVSLLFAAGAAQGDIVQLDPNAFDFTRAQFNGFEDFAVGAPVQTIQFGDVAATVSFSGRAPLTNQIVHGADGFGAVAYEGDQFWRLRADRVHLNFGEARLTQFGFFYSDLEWSDLKLTFGHLEGSYTLTDWNDGTNSFFSYTAAPGEVFGSVTIEWTDDTDSVGFDNMFVTLVPTPGAVAMVAVAGGLFLSRRRRAAI
jgi:hypothetical protein